MNMHQFVEACKSVNDNDAIYDMFEADDELRTEVFVFVTSLGVDLQATPEPTRASMEALGKHFNVQQLIDY